MKKIDMIGSHVSTNARTPKIINKIGGYLGIEITVTCHNIINESELEIYISNVQSDPDWRGTFMTNPLKDRIHKRFSNNILAKTPQELQVYNVFSKDL